MAVTSLQLTFTEIGQVLGTYLSGNRTRASWSTTMETDAVNIIRKGLRKFYYPQPLGLGQPAHQWSFLKPWFTTTTVAPYSTGTVTVVNGAVSGSGTTFPSTSANAWFVCNNQYYEVANYSSATLIQLVDTAIDFSAGTSYELRFYRYALPSDFVSLEGPLTFAADESNKYCTIGQRSEFQLRSLYQNGATDAWASEPKFCAIYPASTATTAVQSWNLMLWPAPAAIFHIRGRYNVQMSDLDGTNQYPPGGAQHSETILEAVLSEAELTYNDGVTRVHTDRFMELLAASISLDRQINSPESLGTVPLARDSRSYSPSMNTESDYLIHPDNSLSDYLVT